ncbi:universal stress protein [Polaromonas sp.]|jgi:nucleotide-binding universal stress UspA family protein|uniref:universal stress protein n=1 Tax=Polaromonas sp. TaxID=1869339 RepID=UPI001E069DE8|nr:universal stress protein [Polaromonas sp.]MBT9475926.1 universal stress protein [Polaromonas sp.]
MTPLHSLLAVTDFSAPARHAADRAAHLAHETGAQLTLLHAVPGSKLDELRQWLGAGHGAEQQLLKDAAERLQTLANELATARRVAIQAQLATGRVLDEIAREADALHADLVVLGARGAGFLRRLMLGTTSERLLLRSTQPLLVVKQTPRGPYRRVLVAVDFSPWSAHAIETARRVAPHARLLLLSAFEVPFEGKLQLAGVDTQTIEHYRRQAQASARQQLDTLAHQAGLKPGHWDACVIEGDAWQRIVEQEQEQDCDLVVLGKHGQSAAEELLLGSVTKSVLAEGSSDVLVSVARAA